MIGLLNLKYSPRSFPPYSPPSAKHSEGSGSVMIDMVKAGLTEQSFILDPNGIHDMPSCAFSRGERNAVGKITLFI